MNKEIIKKIFLKNKKNYKINKIIQLRFGKYIIFSTKNNSNHLFKIATNKYSSKMLFNEFVGYKAFKENKNRNFLLINLKKLFLSKKYFTIQSNLIEGKKGSFFNFKILFPKKYKVFSKNINCKNYINDLLKRDFLCCHEIQKRDLKEKISYLLDNFGTYKLFTYLSHGDLLHFNTIVFRKNTFVYDFEFYKKKRPLYFDFFNWFLVSFFMKIIKINSLSLVTYLAFFYLKVIIKIFQFKNNYFSNVKISSDNYKFYLLIYLIEKILFYEKRKKIAKFNLPKDKKQNKLDLLILIFFNKLFNLVKKFW